jgi:hypothetical protein
MDTHDQESLWFGDDEPSSKRRSSTRRNLGVVLACLAIVAVISVPVALSLSSDNGHAALPPVAKKNTPTQVGQGQARREVLAALSATTGSGSFNVAYEFDPATPPTVTTTTTTDQCNISSTGLQTFSSSGVVSDASVPPTMALCGPGGSPTSTTAVTGHGTIDTDPFGMVAVSDVSGLGMITIRDNGTDIWEYGGADYGLTPGAPNDGPGSSLSGFAGLVESTLGQRQGALAMGGLSSPTGYLDLDQSMIASADQIGTETVDGASVTVYKLSITAAQESTVAGSTPEEAKAVEAANAILASQGYLGTDVEVSIDASGFIRKTSSTARFTDGSTTHSESTFSDFGCAGTVLMPGQSGSEAPPAGCVSPDTGVAPTTTTTTTPPSSTSTSTTSTSSTTAPASLPTTTTTTSTAPTSTPTS